MQEPSFYLNNDFRLCLQNLMSDCALTSHPRGTTTKEILNYNITLVDPRNRVITFADRNTSTKYLLGEFIWYLSAQNTVDAITPYAKFWDNITNPDGTVNSNYGHRLFGEHQSTLVPAKYKGSQGQSQWMNVVEILSKDKESRQAIVNIHVPQDRWAGNKDVPCTLALQFFIREERLHLITSMRSNDIILGFTNDVFQFTMLQEALMLQLREKYPSLELGNYYHNAGSMHIYERHFPMAENIINQKNAFDMSMIPMDRFDDGIVNVLIAIEAAWSVDNYAEDFDFTKCYVWNKLTPYWQTLIKAFFNRDESAMHAIFGQAE